jgi:hypothetical protein
VPLSHRYLGPDYKARFRPFFAQDGKYYMGEPIGWGLVQRCIRAGARGCAETRALKRQSLLNRRKGLGGETQALQPI